MAARKSLERPAFYALAPGGWRDALTLLHPPYTAWHLSYVAIGAGLAPHLDAGRLGWTLGAFFLGVGICAHALDELNGRPLRTKVPAAALTGISACALAGAIAVGIVGILTVSVTIAPLILAGAFIVLAYNLELFGGRFHSDFWFATSWGAFPAFAGFWACSQVIDGQLLLAVSACFALSVAQRRLSAPVRRLRRRTESVEGREVLADGTELELNATAIARPMEAALKACAAGLVLLAVALVLSRL